MAKKTSAASRTVDMWAPPPPIDERPVEVVEATEKGERVPVEEDVDRLRERAFQCQEWTTKAFGRMDAPGTEHRVSFKKLSNGEGYYYVESTRKVPGSGSAYGYVGIMVHERDLYNLATVLVAAVREKQAREAQNAVK